MEETFHDRQQPDVLSRACTHVLFYPSSPHKSMVGLGSTITLQKEVLNKCISIQKAIYAQRSGIHANSLGTTVVCRYLVFGLIIIWN